MTRKAQGLQAYGLLMGKVTSVRARRNSGCHLLLFVQPGDTSHPPYRIAVNVAAATASGPGIQYQVVDLTRVSQASSFVAGLKQRSSTDAFIVAEDDPSVPRLDYVRGGAQLGLSDTWEDVAAGGKANALEAALTAAAKGATVAVFGTGSPVDHRTGARRPTGYDGVDNVHMNQGSFRFPAARASPTRRSHPR